MENAELKKALIEKILQPGDENTRKSRAEIVRKQFWKTMQRAASHIPFMEDVIAAYYCAFDPRTPRRVRAILIAALAYFVMPFDMIPDFFGVIGFSDDVAVLTMVLSTMRAYMTPAHMKAARDALGKELSDK